IAEPGIVADRHQKIRLLCHTANQLWISNFVTDKGRYQKGVCAFSGFQQWLIGRTVAEAGHLQIKERDQPPDLLFKGDKLTKGHQLLFMVSSFSGAEGHDAVVKFTG